MNKKITTTLLIAVFSLLFVGSSLLVNSTAQAAEPDQTVDQLTHKVIGPAAHCSYDSASLAANPELKVVCNYNAAFEETSVEAARYAGLAAFYAAESDVTRINEVNAARYYGLSEFYAAENEATRINEANAARYTGLAAFYAENPELVVVTNRYVAAETKLQRIFEAAARYAGLRYTGLAAFYSENPELMAANR